MEFGIWIWDLGFEFGIWNFRFGVFVFPPSPLHPIPHRPILLPGHELIVIHLKLPQLRLDKLNPCIQVVHMIQEEPADYLFPGLFMPHEPGLAYKNILLPVGHHRSDVQLYKPAGAFPPAGEVIVEADALNAVPDEKIRGKLLKPINYLYIGFQPNLPRQCPFSQKRSYGSYYFFPWLPARPITP